MRKFLRISCTLLLALVFFGWPGSAPQTHASQFMAGPLRINIPTTPLFQQPNIKPGDSYFKDLTVTNTSSQSHAVAIGIRGATGSLARVIEIRTKVDNQPVWNLTIEKLVSNPAASTIVIPVLPAGETRTMQIEAHLPASTGNAYQGVTTGIFRIVFGTEGAFVTPTNLSGIGGTIIAPTPGQTGFLASSSQQDSPTIQQANALIAEATPIPTPQGHPDAFGLVQGASTEKSGNCFWWWVLGILFTLSIALYAWFQRGRTVILGYVWPLVIAAGFYFLHGYLHRFYTESKWCDFFLWYELFILVLYYLSLRFINKEAPSQESPALDIR
jgi:hypothetical protein